MSFFQLIFYAISFLVLSTTLFRAAPFAFSSGFILVFRGDALFAVEAFGVI